jgi:hypothetical protein
MLASPALAHDVENISYAVGSQYDTTHVYVAPQDFEGIKRLQRIFLVTLLILFSVRIYLH